MPYGPPQKPFEQRLSAMGTWALALGIVNIIQMGFGLLNTVFGNASGMEGMQAIPGGGGGMDAQVMQDAMIAFQQKITFVEAIRMVPFIFMSGWSVHMGMRMRKGDDTALKTAQQWVYAAFMVLVFSVALQLFFVLPAMIELTDKMVDSMPAGPGSDEAKAFMGPFMVGAMGFGVVIGALVMAIWPVILKVWSGRLMKERAESTEVF